jgi:hypothetical protein
MSVSPSRGVIGTLDSGSHINAQAERTAEPGRSSRLFGGLAMKDSVAILRRSTASLRWAS